MDDTPAAIVNEVLPILKRGRTLIKIEYTFISDGPLPELVQLPDESDEAFDYRILVHQLAQAGITAETDAETDAESCGYGLRSLAINPPAVQNKEIKLSVRHELVNEKGHVEFSFDQSPDQPILSEDP